MMVLPKTSLALIIATSIPIHISLAQVLTMDHYESVRTLLLGAFDNSTCNRNTDHWDYDPTIDDCIHFQRQRGNTPLVSRLVRQAFHDSTGELDGFVNFNEPFHNGLQGSTIMIDDLYASAMLAGNIPDYLDKADFYAWSYMIATEFAVARAGDDRLINWPAIRYGRRSTTADAAPVEALPESKEHADGAQIVEYFSQEFGFTQRETATLIGAHTLGRGVRAVSGFVGAWNRDDDEFNNDYFQNLINPRDGCNNNRRLNYAADILNFLVHMFGRKDNEDSDEEGNTVVDADLDGQADIEGEADEEGRGGRGEGQAARGNGEGNGGNDNDRRGGRRGGGGSDDGDGRGGGGGGGDNDGDRCLGWEQVPIVGEDGITRFQWRHSCTASGDQCRDLMLNLDMGLFRDIDAYTNDVSGEVTSFPAVLPDDADPELCQVGGRALATCFPVKESAVGDAVREFSSNQNEQDFIDSFADVFDKILSRVADGVVLSVVGGEI